MNKRWLSLFVENNVGVLAKISGMFSGKAYNLESLTVGATEDMTISRMTIGLKSDDETFEQIKKQLNRCVDIIKVIDFTNIEVHTKELMFVKIKKLSNTDKDEILQLTQKVNGKIIDCGADSIIIETTNTDKQNDDLILLTKKFNNVEIVRSGIVAVEGCNKA